MKSWLKYLSPETSGFQSPAGEAEKLTNVWSGCFGTNRIIDNWHRCRGVMWRKRKNYFEKLFLKNLWTVNFHFIDPQNYLHIMRTFLNHIKNKTLDEIKTSLENLWQRMIQLSVFFQDSFVLILKRKCLVGGSRVRCGESGIPSTIINTWWSSWRYELGCDAPVLLTKVSLSSWIQIQDGGDGTRTRRCFGCRKLRCMFKISFAAEWFDK